LSAAEAINVRRLLIYFPDRMTVGQHLSLKLFFSSGFEFNTIETLVKVVWVDVHQGENCEDYRAGVTFVIFTGDSKLIIFLRSLSE
jgi:hypothetical protein